MPYDTNTHRSAPGRGVFIAHSKPSLRMKVAMGLIDRHPVFLTNGARGLLRQLDAVIRGTIRAPQALVLGEPEWRALRASALWEPLGALPLTLILLAARRVAAEGADAVFADAPRPSQLTSLLAA